MKNVQNKAFTLLELLIVVAIIGILTSIVLVATGDARNKGADAGVKSNLQTVRSQAEIFYSNNGNSYVPLIWSSDGPGYNDTCPTMNLDGAGSMFYRDKVIIEAIKEAVRRGGVSDSYCYNSSTQWAVVIPLKSESGTFWCVDSGGASRKVTASSTQEAIDSTTHACKTS